MHCRLVLWNHLVQGFFVLGVFWWLLQFCQLLLVCSGLLLLLHSILEEHYTRHLSFSPRFSNFLAYSSTQQFLAMVYISVVSVVISLLFLIVFIWALSLFFLPSLLKGLSFYLPLQGIQLLDLLIIRIVLLVSMSFSSALILVISFLLLALGCLCCCS